MGKKPENRRLRAKQGRWGACAVFIRRRPGFRGSAIGMPAQRPSYELQAEILGFALDWAGSKRALRQVPLYILAEPSR